MRVGIASDHKGYLKKAKLIKCLEKEFDVIDYGTNSEASVDYSDYAEKLCLDLVKNKIEFGILICYTGIGMSIAANKIKGIRCAKVDNVTEAKLCRLHNNANVIAVSSRKSFYEIKRILIKFLKTDFSNEERHIRRINKISKLEE